MQQERAKRDTLGWEGNGSTDEYSAVWVGREWVRQNRVGIIQKARAGLQMET